MKTYDLSDSVIGVCFMLASFPYLLSAIITPYWFKNTPRKLQFVICFFFSAIGFILMGPSSLFGLPNHLYFLLIGMFILGFVQPIVFIPCLPEAIETFQYKYRIVEGFDQEFDHKLGDTISSMYS